MSDEMRENLAQVLASSRRGVTAKVNDNDRRQADTVMNAFAVVELPPTEFDETGRPEWMVQTRYDDARLYLRESDNRLAMDGVPNLIASADHARSLAGALLAGADHMENRNG